MLGVGPCGAFVTFVTVQGRAAERHRVEAVIDRARAGESGVLVLRGGEGIGKTTLLDHAAAAAAADGIRPLHVVGSEPEASLSFAALHQLCNPLLGHIGQLPEHQAAVLAGALAIGPAMPGDRFTTGVATLGLLAAAAVDQPLLVVLDDAHHFDDASLDAIAFACRRLRSEPIAVLAATALPDGPEVLRAFDDVVLDGLDEADAWELLRRTGRRIARPVARRLWVSTGGNPLDLLQVAALLDDESLSGHRKLPDPLPVGSRLADTFDETLAGLSYEARRVVFVVAVSLSGSPLVVAAACKELDLDASALEEAEAAGLLEQDARAIRFRHPLAKAAVYRAMPLAERRRLHRLLADVVIGDRDLERRAWHLSATATAPDEDVAAAVEAVATDARARGALVAATEAFERAASLTPEPHQRARRLHQAAALGMLGGRAERALSLADEALPLADDDLRPRLQHLRGRALVLGDRVGEARRLLVREAEPPTPPATAAAMLVDAALWALQSQQVDEAISLAERAQELAGEDRRTVAEARLAHGAAMAVAGHTELARGLLAEVDTLVDGGGVVEVADLLCQAVAFPLTWIEDYGAAASIVDRVISAGREVSAPGVLPRALLIRSLVDYRTNRWLAAVASADESLQLAQETGQRGLVLPALAALASAEASLGREADCRAHAGRALELLGPRAGITRVGVISALGSLELGLGRPQEAVAVYAELVEPGGAATGNPGVVLFEPDRIEALIEAGMLDEALAALAHLEERAAKSGNTRALSGAYRCRAMVAGDQVYDGLFASAVDAAAGRGHDYALGRAELRWGMRLEAAGRPQEAVDHLRRARAVLDRLGAELWVARAEDALGRLGSGRPPSAAARANLLSADELRVTQTVADEGVAAAAAALFLSPAAVAQEVDRALEKTGIATVDQLVRELRRQGGGKSVRLLGGFEVVSDDQVVTPVSGVAARAVKLAALVEGSLHVDELVETLWPDAAPGQGRARLRNVLSRLRSTCGPILERRGDLIGLADDVVVDVVAFRSLARRVRALADDPASDALARAALRLYGGDLLPDSIYEPWAAAPRERLRRDRLALLDVAARHADRRGDVDDAVSLLEEAIESEPYDEERYVRLGEVLLRHGRRSAAAAAARRGIRIVSELGLAPSDELRQIERAVRSPG